MSIGKLADAFVALLAHAAARAWTLTSMTVMGSLGVGRRISSTRVRVRHRQLPALGPSHRYRRDLGQSHLLQLVHAEGHRREAAGGRASPLPAFFWAPCGGPTTGHRRWWWGNSWAPRADSRGVGGLSHGWRIRQGSGFPLPWLSSQGPCFCSPKNHPSTTGGVGAGESSKQVVKGIPRPVRGKCTDRGCRGKR